MKKIFATILAICMTLSLAPFYTPTVAAADSYDPSAALSYAAAHWDDGVGLCAQFVSTCLVKGGITFSSATDVAGGRISWNSSVGAYIYLGCWGLYNDLANRSFTTVSTLTLDSSGRIPWASNVGKISKGDVIFYHVKGASASNTDQYTHVVIVSNDSSDTYVQAYAHNNAKNNSIVWNESGKELIVVHMTPNPLPPTNVSVNNMGTKIGVSFDRMANASYYDVYLIQSPWGWEDIKYSVSTTNQYVEFSNITPGAYAAFVIARPNGDFDAQSAWVFFTTAFTINIDASGGTTNISPFKLDYGSVCNLSPDFVSRNGYTFKGWNLYRPADNKWFAFGHGWYTESDINANGYTKGLYSKNLSMTLDDSWLSNRTVNADAFTFYAVWEANSYSVDLNGYIDDSLKESLSGYGTADVYINGTLVADDTDQYSAVLPAGTKYEFKDIKPAPGYSYDGIYSGTRTGTIEGDAIEVCLAFSKNNVDAISETPQECTYNGHRYLFYSTPATWYTAQYFCEAIGGHLVTLESENEEQIVQTLFSDETGVWIGATDYGTEGTWRWVTDEAWNYENWDENEPNNISGLYNDSEDYAHYTKNNSVWVWNDTVGCQQYPFVCEIEPCDHTYNAVVTAPTCTAEGYTSHTCTICGDSYKDTHTDALGHNYDANGVCTRCGALDPDYVSTADLTISANPVTAAPGGTVTIPVMMSGGASFAGFTFEVGSSEGLTLQGIEKGALLKDADGMFTKNLSSGLVNWTGTEDIAGTGELMVLTFGVSETAQDGAELTVTVRLKDNKASNLANASEQPVSVRFEDITVKVQSVVPGDVNEDGEVDTIDSIRLARFLVDLVDLTPSQLQAADVNADGDVTATDAIRLSKYLVGLVDSLNNSPAVSEVRGVVRAVDTATISVGSVACKKGETVVVPVTISDNPGFAGFTLSISASEGLTLKKIEKGSLLSNADGMFTKNVAQGRVNWTASEDVLGDGELMLLTFEVSAEAAEGEYFIRIGLKDGKQSNFANANENVVAVTFTDGKAVLHEHQYTEEVTNPTCIEQGYTTHSCAGCGDSYKDTYTAALGHSYTVYIDNAENHTVACERCGDSKVEDHSYADGECVCGAVEQHTDAALTFYATSIGLEDKIIYSALVNNSVVEDFDSYYVEFVNLDSTNKRMSIHKQDAGTAFGSKYKLFQFPIYVCQMTDRIEATLYGVKDGVTYRGQSVVHSVEEFVLTLMPNLNPKMQKLAANMLEYGAMMQINFDHRTDHLANDELGSYAELVLHTVPEAVDRSTSTNNGYTGASLYRRELSISSTVELQYAFNMDSSLTMTDLRAEITVGGKTTTVDGADFIPMGKRFVVIFSDLLPTQGDVDIEITVYSKTTGRPISETYTDRLAYAVAVYQTSGNETITNAVNAMLNYYRLAEEAYQ